MAGVLGIYGLIVGAILVGKGASCLPVCATACGVCARADLELGAFPGRHLDARAYPWLWSSMISSV
jgi:hypothetical protein